MVDYQYNNLNQLEQVTGFTAPKGISYNDDGSLKGINYANGAKAVYNYDANRRLDDMKVTVGGQELLNLDYTYDKVGNIETVTDNGELKTYEYDNNNQLTKAITPGTFMEPSPTPGTAALKTGDILGNGIFEFAPITSGLMGLDYYSSSIGIDFGSVASGIKMIELVPDKDHTTHRINENTIALYVSSDNMKYTLTPKANWEYQKDSKGIVTLTLKEKLATRYLKLHVKYDERGRDFKAVNKATFLNEVAKMLRVYQEATSRTEEYQYDAAGNRKLLKVTLARTTDFKSEYYTNTDRLKTDGKFAFVYDEAGNMVKKGNAFTISFDTVKYTEKNGEGVEYWEYQYDLLNRLETVKRNDQLVANYEYDPEGFRVVAKKYINDTTLREKRHYVFQGTEPIFEKRFAADETTVTAIKSYIYALGKHLARVDGKIGDPDVKKYWYVTDHLGSVRAVTDIGGKKVWSADYLAFGTLFGKEGNPEFEELHSFTGKELDPDTGLHYYNARWYDSELGRFVSEDPAGDPNNPNLYSYCRNNPLIYIDPTGCISQEEGMALHAANSTGGGNGSGNGSSNPGTGGSSGPSTTETPEPDEGPSTSNGPPKVTVKLGPDGNIESVVIEGDKDGYDISIDTDTYIPTFIPRNRDGIPGEPIPGEPITETKVTITRNKKHSDSKGDGNSENSNTNISDTALDWVQGGLDVAGLIPGFGEIADGANALISLGRGDYAGAALSVAAMIPFAGWGATGGKLALKYGDEAVAAGKSLSKIEFHHLLPRQLKSNFQKVGLNIEEFKIPLEQGIHRLKPTGIHTGPENWNKIWSNFFQVNPNVTQDQILNQLSVMRKNFGI